MLSLIIFSCNPTEDPTLNSRWRLIKVKELDTPTSSPGYIHIYPAIPFVKEKPIFALDADYQIWSWSDSSRVEYTIIYKGLELFANTAHPYELIRDTIHYTDSIHYSRYNFQIIDRSLILNGYGVSQLGKHRFTYYFELDE
ncbi:MAG: hypothetical protein WAT79_10965 [Saprospiraceae bacterium]